MTPQVAPAPPEDFELLLPENVTVEALSASLAEPPAEVPASEVPAPVAPPPAPAPEPVPATVAVAPVPAPAPVVPAKGVVRDLQKERGKRQAAERLATALEMENERLRGEARQRAENAALQPPKDLTWTEAELADLAARANADDKVQNFGDVAKIVVTALTAKVNAARREDAAARVASSPDTRKAEAAKLEQAFKVDNPDYEERLTKAGLWQAILDPASPTYEPATVRTITAAENPAAKAYEIATGRLSIRGELPEAEAEPVAPVAVAAVPAVVPAPVVAPAPVAAAPAPVPVAAAPAPVRDAAAERGLGIRRIPGSGGAPKAAMSREGLTRLMHANYDQYKALLEANPGLEAYHTENIAFQATG